MNKGKAVLSFAAICLVLSAVITVAFAETGQTTGAVSDSDVPTTGVVDLSLWRTYRDCGYVAAGIGVRNTGRGTINIRVPWGSNVVDAWLYWCTLDSDPPMGNIDTLMVSGSRVVGTLIGKGPDPCWGPTTVTTGYTFRAEVKRQVMWWAIESQGGDFGVTVGGMDFYTTPGQDPWDVPPSANWMRPLPEYVALVIVYRGGTVPQGSLVQIFDGYYMQAGGAATFTYNWPARAVGGARWSHVTADGQANANPLTKNVDFGGTVIDQPVFNGYAPSIRSKATISGSLADIDTYNVGSLVSPAGASITTTWNCGSDCIAWGALIYWTTSDNPP